MMRIQTMKKYKKLALINWHSEFFSHNFDIQLHGHTYHYDNTLHMQRFTDHAHNENFGSQAYSLRHFNTASFLFTCISIFALTILLFHQMLHFYKLY